MRTNMSTAQRLLFFSFTLGGTTSTIYGNHILTVEARHSKWSNVAAASSIRRSIPSPTKSYLPTPWTLIRGGSTTATTVDADADEESSDDEAEEPKEKDITSHPEFHALQSYRMQQQILLQLRATYLSEALAKRGIPIPTLNDVGTPEGATPPQSVDWDCAMSTEEDPKSCLFSFDAEPGTKVVAPLGSTQWIGLATLNRLRREDPTKVEPMWHSKYSILQSWFDTESEYSLLQHVGIQGFFLNALLQGHRLQMTLFVSLVVLGIMFMPVLEYIVNRFLVSSLVWTSFPRWYRFVHAALPLKLFIGQMIFGYAAKGFGKLSSFVKDMLVQWECNILEQSIPLTVGVPDIVPPSRNIRQSVESDTELFDGLEEDEDQEEETMNIVEDDSDDDNDDELDFDTDDEE